MTNITPLRPEVSSELIEFLEMMLEEAKSGELISLAAVGHMKDMQLRFVRSQPPGMRDTEIIGAARFLEYKLCKGFDEGD